MGYMNACVALAVAAPESDHEASGALQTQFIRNAIANAEQECAAGDPKSCEWVKEMSKHKLPGQ
jgi:hypothetical protein